MAALGDIFSTICVVSLFYSGTLAIDFNFPAVFNFGDSNSDTGDLVAAGIGEPLLHPNGRSYFSRPAGRFCDGRLVIDFLMDAIDFPFLNAYLNSIGMPSFQNGCNFAAAGSTILPPTKYSVSPFSFGVQVAQFLRLKNEVLQLLSEGKLNVKYMPQADYFSQGLYMFDIGQNDLASAFYSKNEDQVIASIPTILSEFERGLKKLYEQGARRFWIHNTGPLGCLAQNIAIFGKDPSKQDEHGCLSAHNRAAKQFNIQLHALSKQLRYLFPDANITYVDVFTIKFNLIANFSRYGFEHPVMACCGHGGPPLNYHTEISCGQTKILKGHKMTVKACDDATEHLNWDGIHYTEAANLHVASQILSGRYSDPSFIDDMPFALKLKF
ncbi:GDSL esterase/lipase At1g54790-like [Zingiber officinale]|uniref:GDSL esterase/lipase At1g54790-like n=1 Tax=Zingiber officinale TaxID=94328 RepID=UPI001C4C9FF7|nr:GDSL esterase/lipase At1g54790-like [Zingiber officinale]